ncbi:hypothetical protein VP01_1263g4 [Puccinia sorghi]|uniref:Uncharacterized protein n=1 Tax=Puccinia sorghi TaxID=27349 RepID=A0A0L6VQM5_9BASI|nr:hypothetical protein VP01_1263g4 [Puccinia sorghi]
MGLEAGVGAGFSSDGLPAVRVAGNGWPVGKGRLRGNRGWGWAAGNWPAVVEQQGEGGGGGDGCNPPVGETPGKSQRGLQVHNNEIRWNIKYESCMYAFNAREVVDAMLCDEFLKFQDQITRQSCKQNCFTNLIHITDHIAKIFLPRKWRVIDLPVPLCWPIIIKQSKISRRRRQLEYQEEVLECEALVMATFPHPVFCLSYFVSRKKEQPVRARMIWKNERRTLHELITIISLNCSMFILILQKTGCKGSKEPLNMVEGISSHLSHFKS